MHEKANLDTMEVRWETHLITLMFRRSMDIKYVDATQRITRQADAILLKAKPKTNRLKYAQSTRGVHSGMASPRR